MRFLRNVNMKENREKTKSKKELFKRRWYFFVPVVNVLIIFFCPIESSPIYGINMMDVFLVFFYFITLYISTLFLLLWYDKNERKKHVEQNK